MQQGTATGMMAQIKPHSVGGQLKTQIYQLCAHAQDDDEAVGDGKVGNGKVRDGGL